MEFLHWLMGQLKPVLLIRPMHRTHTHKKNRLLSVAGLVLLFGFLAVPGWAQAGNTPSRPDSGLLFYAKAEFAYQTGAIENPSITGAFFQIIWSEVEDEKGELDWSEVDTWIEPWVEAGKHFALRIMWSTSGNWRMDYYKTPTPQWVWDAGAKFAYHEPSKTEMPLIWDPIYMKHAFEFMRAVEERYGSHPNLLFIDVTPGAETNPYRFGTIDRTDPGFREIFSNVEASDGRTYSDNLWMETLQDWILGSANIFTSAPPLVTLNVAGMGRDAPDKLYEVGRMCVENGYYVGQNGIRRDVYRNDSNRRRAWATWAPQTRLFFEMVAGTGRLTGTLMDVMKEAERINCHFLNVYPRDVLRGTRGREEFDPEFEEALIYGAKVMKSSVTVPSGVSEVNGEAVLTYEQESDLRRLEEYARRSELGPDQRGRFTHYYRTDTDRSVQPVGMHVPANLTTDKKYPLVIQLHGRGPKRIAGVRAGWPGMRDHEWIDPDLEVIYAQPYARQNSGYRGIAESEVLQVYRMVKDAYPVDPDRIYLMGHSMGGGGALNIALHHPDLFAGVIAIDSALRWGSYADRVELPDWQQDRRNTYNVHQISENAYNMPVRLHSAGGGMRYSQIDLYERMKEAGNLDPRLKVHEGMPHHFAAQLPYYTFIPEILEHRRNSNPERVRFRTNTLQYGKAYWTEILGIETYGKFARIDAQRVGDAVEISTENINRLKIALDGFPEASFVRIDGTEIELPGSSQTVILEKQERAWRISDASAVPGMRRFGLQGPIADAFASEFLLVYGDEEDFYLAQAEADAIRNPSASRECLAGDFPFKSAAEVTVEDIARYHLILFGSADSNPLIRTIGSQVPFQATKDGVHEVGGAYYPNAKAIFIHPNPLNPERYAVVWSGPVLSRVGGQNSISLLDLPDFIIIQDEEIVAGFFNHGWER